MTVGDVVVVTGFGPFGVFTENPSSQVVDLLAEKKIPGFDGKLVTEKMNVTYAEVEKTVKRIWKDHNPKLVVHIGVHPCNRHIKLERRSFGRGYTSYDNDGCVPIDNVCPTCTECSDFILNTSIDCSSIAAQVSDELGFKDLKITASDDPGRYLCAYSFYLSLSHDESRSLFIHIPPFDSACTLEMVTTAVQNTIVAILKTLD
ncbi:hypothetical protein RB195_006178 [Necator americanus]|uniref:Uncharacterized protein n=2 Tax=Necator americanus TaxID=51031 RepID=A0ABR1BRC5_NECAM|nr:pyroglutamyl-peptidase I [Necator americanus]ETN84394.1 pyroglutamyl-peptidase I [Necator americanus]